MDFKKYTEGESLSAEELEAMSAELIQAKFDRDKRTDWARRLKEEYGVKRAIEKPKRAFPFSKLAVAAILTAIAALVTYSVVLFSTPNYNSIVEESIENLITIDTYAVVTRGNEDIDTLVLQALDLYKKELYASSIAVWQDLISKGEVKGVAEYNIALCYLKKEPPVAQKAITNLLEARQTKTVQQEANWALALVYLQTNQKEKATKILEGIIQAKAYKYKKAQALLESL